MKELGDKLPKGGAAMFVLVQEATRDKVMPEIAKYGGHVIQTRSRTSRRPHSRRRSTSAAPPPGPSDRLTYVGHATVLVELGGVRLLTDLLLRPPRASKAPARRPRGSAAGLDAVLISHLTTTISTCPRCGGSIRVFA